MCALGPAGVSLCVCVCVCIADMLLLSPQPTGSKSRGHPGLCQVHVLLAGASGLSARPRTPAERQWISIPLPIKTAETRFSRSTCPGAQAPGYNKL